MGFWYTPRYARGTRAREHRETKSDAHRRPKIRSWRIRASVCRIRSGFPCADTRVTLCAFEQDVCSAAGVRVCNARHIDSRPLCLSFSLSPLTHAYTYTWHSPIPRTFCSRARQTRHNIQVPAYAVQRYIAEPPSFNFPDLLDITRGCHAAYKRPRINDPLQYITKA